MSETTKAISSGRANRLLLIMAVSAISFGLAANVVGMAYLANGIWAAATTLAILPLAFSVFRSLRKRTPGVDIIALIAMLGALAFHEFLAGALIALMLSGGKTVEDFAQWRARLELSALLSRAPQSAHRYEEETLTTIRVEDVLRGDLLLIGPGEVVPVDGVVADAVAVLDESALTGEATPVERRTAEQVRSGAINSSGAPFKLRATATAETSTYAGIIRLVRQAQDSKAPLVRLANQYALFFLPLTIAVSGVAWLISGSPIRALAVLVVATPCPLILAAPIAIVAGISRAARRGIIVKGGGALETIARGQTLVLDKTGTVTAGAPALTNIETFGAQNPDELLRLAASIDQVSPHVLAGPILQAARERGLEISFPGRRE